MDEASTVALLIDLLAKREPFCHVRFGDGDVMFASGVGSKITADGEEWSRELQGMLLTAWLDLAQADTRLLVGDVESYDVSDGCEQEWGGLKMLAEWTRDDPLELVHIEALRCSRIEALTFYLAARDDPRRKVYIGPAHLAKIITKLDCMQIQVPLYRAYEVALEAVQAALSHRPEIILFSAGRGGKIMQSIIARTRPEITQIDVGSGLDLLVPAGVRRGTDLGVDRMTVVRRFQQAGL